MFQSRLSTADIRRQQIRVFQIEVNGPKTFGAENQGFSFQSEKSRREQDPAVGAPSKGKAKEKATKVTVTTPREQIPNVGSRKPNGSFQKGGSCKLLHVLECAKFKSPGGCEFGVKCDYKHSEFCR